VNLLDLVLIVAALALMFHWAVMFALTWWESPEYFKRFGVIILRPEGLDGHGELIGRYGGAPIYRSVSFKGMDYEFAGVVPPRYARRIDENELLLEPGLLYVFHPADAGGSARAVLHR
jgi:hypothetical protein